MFELGNVFDSGEVEDRIDELMAEFGEALEIEDEVSILAAIHLRGSTQENYDEYKELVAFRGEVDSREWEYGVMFIAEHHFTDYAEELVKDIGDMPREIPGYIVIDWEKTAENIKQDYSTVDFRGETYYYRD